MSEKQDRLLNLNPEKIMKKLTLIFTLLFLVFGKASADVIQDAVNLMDKNQGKKAIELLSDPSNSENAKALFLIGMIHDSGKGVESNQVLAGKYYLAAAKKGHDIAQLYTGLFYKEGIGFERNVKKAIYWLKKASHHSESVSARALFMLGTIHDSGNGVESNQVLAGKYYLAAAKKGHVIAQLNTGLFFEKGVGFEKDTKKAIYWLRMASQQKSTRAMGMLSALIVQNNDNIVEAYAWSHIAAKYDPIQASTTGRYLIASYCSKEQIEAGKKLIQEIESKWVSQ